MFQIDIMSRVPVYEQIIEQAEKFILTDILVAGDKMPSVRALSIQLSVNPNTIQKAITELDRRGIIYSVPGKGCFISDDAKGKIQNSKRESMEELKQKIRELTLAGISKGEILASVEEVFNEEERKYD